MITTMRYRAKLRDDEIAYLGVHARANFVGERLFSRAAYTVYSGMS